MFENLIFTENIPKSDYKEKTKKLKLEINQMQRYIIGEKIPLMIVIEGLPTAGKGEVIEEIVEAMDPRWFQVFRYEKKEKWERQLPFIYSYFLKIAPKGKIFVYDRSWYWDLFLERFFKNLETQKFYEFLEDIIFFEKTLTQNGSYIIKFFLHISKKKQKKRIEKLKKQPEMQWQVNKQTKKIHKNYEDAIFIYEYLIKKTDTLYTPWILIPSDNKKESKLLVLENLVNTMENIIGKTFRDKAREVLIQENISFLSI